MRRPSTHSSRRFLGSSATVSSAPPVITSLNYMVGDTAGGGQSIVITGTGLASPISVTFGGTSATVTASSATSITATLPAHAAGVVDVAVTTAVGTDTSVGAFEYWLPSQLSGVDMYFDSNKGVTSSGGEISAWALQSGTSGNASQGTSILRPTVGTGAFGTLPSVNFSGSQYMMCSGIAAAGPYSLFAVVKTTSTDTTVTQPGFNLATTLLAGSGGWGSFGMTDGAVGMKLYNSSPANQGSGLNSGDPVMIGVTTDGTPTYTFYSKDSQVGSPVSPGGTNLLYYDTIGTGYLVADFWVGDVGAIVTLNSVISGANLTQLGKWASQRFGVA